LIVVAGGAALAAVIAVASTTGGSDRGPDAAPTKAAGSPVPAPSSSPVVVRPIPTGSFNAAANNILNPSTKTGGTLRLLAGEDCDSWDPGRTSYGWCWNMQRLITRTLIGYAKVNGSDFELAPDLATSLGQHNADCTQWTYTLKPGLTYANGKPITPMDVKYGIERLFSHKVIKSNPYTIDTIAPYFYDAIAHPMSYGGTGKNGDLHSITTTSTSITFHLSHPDADFDYLMALPPSAPVPYGKQPVASGPFEIGAYHRNRSVVFVRNPHWRQSTDSIRHPLVDSVRLQFDHHPYDIDRQLRAGRADACADCGVLDRFRNKILASPKLRDDADDPVIAGTTQYLAISPSVIPNVHCRRAIFYAVDKVAATRVFGGQTAAVPASSMTPPGFSGFDPDYDPYPSGPQASGDLDKAEQELLACGKPNGFTTKVAYGTPSETGPNLYRAEQTALDRVGIKFTVGDLPSTYFCANASPALLRHEGIGLVSTALTAAYPTGYGFYGRIHQRFRCLQDDDANLRSLHDPTVDRVLHAAALGRASDADWQSLDRAVMATATYLPLVWRKTLYYRGPRMTNVTCDIALAAGIYDFVNIGVR
jgi:peptide/nickel transport system substrate-binding protein